MSSNLVQHIVLAFLLGIPSPLTALLFFRYLERTRGNENTGDTTRVEYERVITELCIKISTLEKERQGI